MIQVLDEQTLAQLAVTYRLNHILLFGSALTDAFNEASDIDIAVLRETPLSLDEQFELEMFFEDQYSRPIDIVDLRNNQLDFFIKINILNTGKTLYTNDEGKMLACVMDEAQWYYKENETFFYFRKRDLLS